MANLRQLGTTAVMMMRRAIDNSAGQSDEMKFQHGVDDRIHLLIGSTAALSIAQTVKLIKGESSYYNNLITSNYDFR